LHAVEILSQKGHRDYLTVLIQSLQNPTESIEVKVKILEIFYKIKNRKTLPVILELFYEKDEELVFQAVKTLSAFTKLGEKVFDQGFSRYRVIEELKKLFTSNASERVREAVVQTLAILRYEDIVPFLLEAMKMGSERFQVACVRVCALFQDPMLADYLVPFLDADSPFVRAHTALALRQFAQYEKRIKVVLDDLAASTQRNDFLAYVQVIGDLGNQNDRSKLLAHFENADPILKITIAYALFKLGYKNAEDNLVHLLFSGNLLVLEAAKELFSSLKPDRKKLLQNSARREVSRVLQPFFSQCPPQLLEECVEIYKALEMRSEAEHLASAAHPHPNLNFITL